MNRYLIGVYLTGVHLMAEYPIGVYLWGASKDFIVPQPPRNCCKCLLKACCKARSCEQDILSLRSRLASEVEIGGYI